MPCSQDITPHRTEHTHAHWTANGMHALHMSARAGHTLRGEELATCSVVTSGLSGNTMAACRSAGDEKATTAAATGARSAEAGPFDTKAGLPETARLEGASLCLGGRSKPAAQLTRFQSAHACFNLTGHAAYLGS